MTDNDRAKTRSDKLLPEELTAGSDDPDRQARFVLDDSDRRQADRDAAPASVLEHRRSEETVAPER